ncbi:MAG: hypothetical protein AAGF90_18710, partial [Pseudomonadota bacterium]
MAQAPFAAAGAGVLAVFSAASDFAAPFVGPEAAAGFGGAAAGAAAGFAGDAAEARRAAAAAP